MKLVFDVTSRTCSSEYILIEADSDDEAAKKLHKFLIEDERYPFEEGDFEDADDCYGMLVCEIDVDLTDKGD